MSYGDYLHLDKVLNAQSFLSDSPDELLFIIQHQTSELWMKLAIHEISSAMRAMRADDLQPAFKMLTRVARIFEQLNGAWDVLRTMTPSEYTSFRDDLGKSSGFQSWQYRAVEFLAGNRNLAMLKPHAHEAETLARLEAILAEPSLYDEAILLLGRNGFDIGADGERDDWRASRTENDAVTEAWRSIYASPREHWMLYDLAEKLGRLRGLLPPLALQPRHDGRAHHRVEARHRRHSRRPPISGACLRWNCFRNCGR